MDISAVGKKIGIGSAQFAGGNILSNSEKNRAKTLPIELYEHRNTKAKASRFLFSRADSHIEFWVNPHDCVWHIATRTAIEKIQGGAVHHEWAQSGTNRNASFTRSRWDQPTVSFAFQSGCINLDSYKDIKLEDFSYPLTISPGVGNFYDFIRLLEETNMNKDGSPNYVTITYSSPTFGKRGILLEGYFTEEGVTWTESAEQPNQISNWGATFMVFNCTPALSELRGNWENPDVFI